MVSPLPDKLPYFKERCKMLVFEYWVNFSHLHYNLNQIYVNWLVYINLKLIYLTIKIEQKTVKINIIKN